MSKTEKMRARLATMAKEREDFVAQKSALEAEMKDSSLGKLAPAAVAEQQEAQELAASGSTGGPRPPLLRRRSSGVGISDTPTSSQSQLTPYNSSSNLLSNPVPVIVPGGSRISDWAFSSIISMDAATDAPPVVKVNEVYETVRNLGRGAFGDVFLVRNVEDSRLFADKTIFCEKESLFADILRELFFL